jgi:hypothetical protein
MAREGHAAQVSCRILAVSESGFYAQRCRVGHKNVGSGP